MKAAKTYVCEAENSSTKYAENTWNEANRTLLFKIQTSEQILKKSEIKQKNNKLTQEFTESDLCTYCR